MKIKTISFSIITSLLLLGCADMPALIQAHETDKPDYTRGDGSSPSAKQRVPLDVPPELRAEVQVPMPEGVAPAKNHVMIPQIEKVVVAGQAVALNARLYDLDAAVVFSAVIDAMTALNRPVQSVDSPSGTVTTDWIRQGVDNINNTSAQGGMFGGAGVLGVRYRFVVRVLRQGVAGDQKTRLEVRTIGQAFMNRHWVNRSIHRKVSTELFVKVEERLQIVRATDSTFDKP